MRSAPCSEGPRADGCRPRGSTHLPRAGARSEGPQVGPLPGRPDLPDLPSKATGPLAPGPMQDTGQTAVTFTVRHPGDMTLVTIILTVLPPVSALGGVWLTSRLQAEREARAELRRIKREVYVRWLQFTENAGTWAFAGTPWSEWQRQLHDLQAQLDLVASDAVRAAIRGYFDRLPAAAAALEVVAQQQDLSEQEAASAMGVVYGTTMEPHRENVLQVMRQELGIETTQR